MDEAWERAVEAALGGGGGGSPARSLTLDGAVKCLHGRLPAPEILERHQSLEHLSIAGVGVASLAGFPHLRHLTRLTLSDNRISGGLEHLVAAGLAALRDLDLSNNRIQFLDDLAPLASLRLVSLDLYECPVTRVKDYRSRVFAMIRTLKYLDKMDADENERPESDEEDDEDDDEEDDDDDDEEDPGSGEVDGEDRVRRAANGGVGAEENGSVHGVIDVDEEESDADEENGLAREGDHRHANGFRVAAAGPAQEARGDDEEEEEDVEDEEDDDDEYDEEVDLGEEIDEEEVEEEDVVEVHDVASSDEEGDGVEEDGEDEAEEEPVDEYGDGDEDEEDVEDEEEDGEPESTGRVPVAAGGEIDGHEQGEEDENGEIGEEDEQGLDDDRDDRVYEEGNGDDDDEDEDEDTEYLVQPIAQPQAVTIASDFGANDDDDDAGDEVDDDEEANHHESKDQPSSSVSNKRKRGDEPEGSNGDDDDAVEDLRPFKHH